MNIVSSYPHQWNTNSLFGSVAAWLINNIKIDNNPGQLYFIDSVICLALWNYYFTDGEHVVVINELVLRAYSVLLDALDTQEGIREYLHIVVKNTWLVYVSPTCNK